MRTRRYQPTGIDPRITPREVFLNRRAFVQAAAVTAIAPAACPAACTAQTPNTASDAPPPLDPPLQWPEGFAFKRSSTHRIPNAVASRRLTPRVAAASKNNFYEFLFGRGGPVWALRQALPAQKKGRTVEGVSVRPIPPLLAGKMFGVPSGGQTAGGHMHPCNRTRPDPA